MRRRRAVPYRRALAAFLLPLFLVSALPGGLPAGQEGLRPLLKPGESAPAFTLRDLDGNDVSFRPGDGKPALVVFWSAFCPTCREVMPGINGFSVRHRSKVRVLGVNLDGKRFAGPVRDYIREAGILFPVGLDALQGDYFLASDPFGVEKTPTAVLVDASGTVRGSWAAWSIREFLADADSIVAALQQGASPRQ